MKDIELDSETKEFIQKTATLFGIDSKSVQSVYEYLLLTWCMKLAQNIDKKVISLQIPYMGTVGLRFGDTDILNENNELELDMDNYLILSDEFKHIVQEVRNKKTDYIAKYIRQNMTDKLVDNIMTK